MQPLSQPVLPARITETLLQKYSRRAEPGLLAAAGELDSPSIFIVALRAQEPHSSIRSSQVACEHLIRAESRGSAGRSLHAYQLQKVLRGATLAGCNNTITSKYTIGRNRKFFNRMLTKWLLSQILVLSLGQQIDRTQLTLA